MIMILIFNLNNVLNFTYYIKYNNNNILNIILIIHVY